MLRVNPVNVLNLLIFSFEISNIPQTPVNNRKIELHETIKDIQNAIDNASFAMQSDTTLEFGNFWSSKLLDAELVEELEELEENSEDEEEDSCTEQEREIL